MVLRKAFRVVYDKDTKVILFASEFDPKSFTHLGKDRKGKGFDTESEMKDYILQKGLTSQPEPGLT